METIKRLYEFLRNYDPYEYNDTGCDEAYLRETLKEDPEAIINFLLDIIEEEVAI